MAEYEYHYSRFPALKAYIDRINAVQKNHKRFVVEQRIEKYPKTLATIRIVDKKIDCAAEEYAPTAEERAAIELELTAVEFPKSVRASRAQVEDLIKTGKILGTAYIFFDRLRQEVIFVQDKVKKQDSDKYFVAWTLFMAPGGQPTWKQMEPDGDSLPFWKPPINRKKPIMVHEGATPAAFLDDLINNPDPEWRRLRASHPWIEHLNLFEHWGAPGGALALHHRCDLDELSTEDHLVFACDNDRNGEIAVQLFSRAWRKELTMLRWDKRFKVGWDLANAVPEQVERIPMWSFAEPATWATTQIGETSHKRPLYALSEVFAEQWVHVTEPELYISVRFPRKIFAQREFDHHCAAFSDKGVRLSELLKSAVGGVRTVNYRPDLETGRHTTLDGEKFFNVHVPRKWAPYKKLPDVKPWEDMLDAVFPNPLDRQQRRAVRRYAHRHARWSMLCCSSRRPRGKTTFADVLRDILGSFNCTYVNEQQIIGRFTGWMEHRLIICEEIYAGHSAAAYDKLKAVITNKTVTVEKKFLHEYDIDNFAHIIA